jgi:hypothetical protein
LYLISRGIGLSVQEGENCVVISFPQQDLTSGALTDECAVETRADGLLAERGAEQWLQCNPDDEFLPGACEMTNGNTGRPHSDCHVDQNQFLVTLSL